MTQHDTPEAVEKAAKYAAAATPDAGYTAAMLRRLHARAVEAEAMCAGYRANESDLLAERDALAFERNNLLASLATARADALREAAVLMEERRALYAARQRSAANVGNIAKLDHWHARQSEAGEAHRAILSLIPAQEDKT